MKSTLGLIISVGAFVSLTYCSAPGTTDSGEKLLVLEPCSPGERIPDGLCGHVSVFEDRETESGRRIDLRVVVLPALSGAPEPDPLFILAGGPGQAATDILGTVLGVFRDIHRTRDLVLVDQRGTGGSNPLSCELGDEQDDEQLLMDPMADTLLLAETLVQLRECAESLDADPRLYTTPIAMDDLDDVRSALGYEVVNLWGVSYGTRAGLVYMRQHPDRVRTAVLDGLAPPSIRLPLNMGRDGNRALSLMLAACADSEYCSSAFPDLDHRLDVLLETLERAPIHSRVTHPRTGAQTDVTISRTSVASVVRGTLYNPQLTALLPLAISEAAEGRFETLAALSLGVGGGGAEIYTGMFLSVICAEDVPWITELDRDEAEADRLFGTRLIDAFSQLCSVWPSGRVAADYGDPVQSDIPVLLLSGEMDPVTPPRWAELTGQTLPNSLHITVPGAAHNSFATGCVPDLIKEFIDAGTSEDLDVACAADVERPHFFDSPLGPQTGGRP